MLDQIGKPQKQQEQPQTTKRITEQLMNACFPHLSGAINWGLLNKSKNLIQ